MRIPRPHLHAFHFHPCVSALSPRRTRWFVAVLVAVTVGVAVVVGVVIRRAWADEAWQERLARARVEAEAARGH